MKQNIELKKENSELIKILKKSKEVIRDEIGKYKTENAILKKFAEASWPWVDGKLDEKLKEELKPLLTLSREAGKMNSTTTNHTDNLSAERSKSERDEIESLKQRLAEKEAESQTLLQDLAATKAESESIVSYIRYTKVKTISPSAIKKEQREVLPVDSANVGSDADEEEPIAEDWEKRRGQEGNGAVLPGFIKSLTLRF